MPSPGRVAGSGGWSGVDNSPLARSPLGFLRLVQGTNRKGSAPRANSLPNTNVQRASSVHHKDVPTVLGHSSAHRGHYRHLPVALGPWMSSHGAVRARTQLPRHQGLSACFLLCRHAAHEAGGQALREALGSHRLHTSQVMTAVTSHPYWALPEPRPLPGRSGAANKPRPQLHGVTKLCYVHAMGRC